MQGTSGRAQVRQHGHARHEEVLQDLVGVDAVLVGPGAPRPFRLIIVPTVLNATLEERKLGRASEPLWAGHAEWPQLASQLVLGLQIAAAGFDATGLAIVLVRGGDGGMAEQAGGDTDMRRIEDSNRRCRAVPEQVRADGHAESRSACAG